MTEHDEDPVRGRCHVGILRANRAGGIRTFSWSSGASAATNGEREGRVRELIRQKHAADAVAARSAAEAAAMRGRLQNPGRPQDYRAPEDYTRAVAEHAVREVGADMLSRQAAQAQELAAKAAQDAWSEIDSRSSAKRCRISMPSRTTQISP